MSNLASRFYGLITRLDQRINAMAAAMLDDAGSPGRCDDAARDEFTAKLISGLDPAARWRSEFRHR